MAINHHGDAISGGHTATFEAEGVVSWDLMDPETKVRHLQYRHRDELTGGMLTAGDIDARHERSHRRPRAHYHAPTERQKRDAFSADIRNARNEGTVLLNGQE